MVIFHESFRLLASECLGLRTAEPSGAKQPSVIRNCPSTSQYDQYAKECIHLWLNPCLSLFISLSLLFRLVEPNQTKQLWHTNIIGVYPIFEINWLVPNIEYHRYGPQFNKPGICSVLVLGKIYGDYIPLCQFFRSRLHPIRLILIYFPKVPVVSPHSTQNTYNSWALQLVIHYLWWFVPISHNKQPSLFMIIVH